MSEKLLSISIAAYNIGNMLSETLNSLTVDEHLMNYMDIIIVNDGSVDCTLQIAEEYRNKHPQSVRVINKKNEGFGSTINYGIMKATGKYFMLLDGDDWFNTAELQSFLSMLKSCDADIILAPYQNVYMGSGKTQIVNNHDYVPTRISKINCISEFKEVQMHEMIIRTDILKRNNISVANCFYTDSELALKALLYTESVIRYPRVIYRYRLEREGQSVSLDGTRKHYRAKVIVADHMQKALIERYDKIVSEKMLRMLEKKVSNITGGVYSAYMIQLDPEKYKNELKKYDRRLKDERRYIYDLSGDIKKVKLVRILNFHFYRLVCAYVVRKAARQ